MKFKNMLLSVALAIATIFHMRASASTNEAAALFEKYVNLERSYDPALADLYSDTARLRLVVKYPNQTTRTNVIPTATFKPMIARAMEEGKRRGETDAYSAPTFRLEQDRIRIFATRTSSANQNTNPVTLLIAQTARPGPWQIVEQSAVSEAKPFLDEKKQLQPKQEWNREITFRQAGTVIFKITAGGPVSITVLSSAAYEALKQKDIEAFRQQGVVFTKDSSGPELVESLKLDAGNYYFIIRNNQSGAAELLLQCYAAGPPQ